MSSIILSIFFLFFQFDILFSQSKVEQKVEPKKKQKKKQKYSQETEDYLELFHTVFNRLNTSYVDSINSSELILSGIKGLMKPLDPYTKLLMGRSKENYDVLRKGKYGGIGISIDEVRDTIIKEWDWVSVNGSSGNIYLNKIELVDVQLDLNNN